MTSTTQLTPQLRLFRQKGRASDQSYASPPNFCATHTLSISKLETPKPSLDWFKIVQPRTLSALEEDFDHLPPLEEGEATAHRGAIISNNYSDSATHVTWDLVRGSYWSGRFGHRKGMTPFRSLKSSPPQFIATPGELPFKEGRPLPPSDEDEGQVVQSAKRFTPIEKCSCFTPMRTMKA
jgi:hypothetical protein